MLCNVSDLCTYTLAATDGRIGPLRDLYVDDLTWTVRFLVARMDAAAAPRYVLIAPPAIAGVDRTAKLLLASLTRQQVNDSPDVDTEKPVSRQHEVEQYGYYGFPFYWGEPALWGNGGGPGMSLSGHDGLKLPDGSADQRKFAEAQRELHRQRGDDPHLRSCRALNGYHIHATDGGIGHVAGIIVDDEAWVIRYLVVDTSDWWLGHQVLIAPQWISEISWLEATVALDMTRGAIKSAPPYDARALPDRLYESRIHDHHGRTAYWRDAAGS